MKTTRTISIEIKGMSCAHCVAHVRGALEAVPGVHLVKVSLEPGSATVSLDELADPRALVAAIEEEGYEARVN